LIDSFITSPFVDLRRSQSSVGTPSSEQQKGDALFPDPPSPRHRTHRVGNSDASSIDLSFDEQGNLSPLPFSVTPLCIQQLGPIGAEILTGNQKQSIVELCHLLMGGILVLKHGRSGKPNLRTLYCDEGMTSLYWSEVGKVVDGRGNVIFDATGLIPVLPSPHSPLCRTISDFCP
jgi:hypothetical protein